MNNRFIFYIGIDPKDKQAFVDFFDSINEGLLFRMEIKGEFDAMYDYYTYSILGTWDAYRKFLGTDNRIIKSVEHYEE